MGAHGKMAALGAILALLGSVLDAQTAVPTPKTQGRWELDEDIHPPPKDQIDADFVIINGVRHPTHLHDGRGPAQSQGAIHWGDMEMEVQEEEERELQKLQNYIARMKKDPSLPPPDPQEFPSIRFHGTSIAALEKSVQEAKEDLAGPNINTDGAKKPEVQSLLDVLNGEPGVVARRAEHNDRDDEEEQGRERQQRLMLPDPAARWTNGIVPYVFTFNNTQAIRGIGHIMQYVESHTCIRFVPYEGPDTRQKYGLDHDGFLKFILGDGCFADVGNLRRPQVISCCLREACIHEIGHALGLGHEHWNAQIDDFVRVHFEAVVDGMEGAFSKRALGGNAYQENFDVTSVMSYFPSAFAKPGMKTMTLLDENSRFGQGRFYYFMNIVEGHNCKAMNCSSFTQHCVNDGFVSLVNGQCACLCPPGLDPATGCTSVIKGIGGCGGYYELFDSNTAVRFTSPNYPRDYPSNARCHYFVKGPVDSTLVLTFEDFTLDKQCKDTLGIRFNNPGEDATIFCRGNGKLQGSFQSTRNFLSLSFNSKKGVTAKGFKALVRMVKDSELCYSKKDKGASYRGTKNYTRTFKPCVPWSEVTHCRMSLFGSSDGEYGLEENYCRNPGFGLRPWCYVNAKTCERVYCDVCNLDQPRDTRDDCAALQSSGQCAQNPRLALSSCALTCNAQLPKDIPPPSASTVSCGTPPPVPHASILESPKAVYAVGDKVTYKCQDGYETMSSSCLTTGAWSPVNYVCGGCSDGWFYSDGFCYGYELIPLSSEQAMKKCASYNGGILTPVKNAKELAVVGKLRDLRWEYHPIRIGLNDTKTEGVFFWADGTPASNIPWVPGRPVKGNNKADCGQVTGDSKVFDNACHHKLSFGCRTALRVPATHPASSTLICVDRRADCQVLFEKHPGFCRNHEGFAMMSCRLTCGLCDRVRRHD